VLIFLFRKLGYALINKINPFIIGEYSGLRPGTLVGYVAFYLFPIHALFVVVLKAKELKIIDDLGVWLVELFW